MSNSEPPRLSEAKVQELIDRLPLGIALAGADGAIRFSNECFRESFDPARLDHGDFARNLHDFHDAWYPIRLARRDGREVDARAQAISASDSIMLVVDDASEPRFARTLEELRARVAELEKLSSTDALTGAWNRRHLDRVIHSELSRSLRSRQPVSLVLADIDRFKRINDTFGHQAGDAVLRELVQVIQWDFRASDSVFRWGGEEFVVLAAASGYRAAGVLAGKLRRRVEQHAFAGVGQVTVSVGVAEYLSPEPAADWFGRADRALYAAKSGGRNQVSVDRRGNSDQWAGENQSSVLRLAWQEEYECGEPIVDEQHRKLFELANALIGAAIATNPDHGTLKTALDALLAHVVRHFSDEEALLVQRGYKRIAAHKFAHAGLLERAMELKAAAEAGEATLGGLVDFVANDVVARHLLHADRDFFPLFRADAAPSA